MKYSNLPLLFTLALLFCYSVLSAQIKPNTRMTSFGPQPALEVPLPKADEHIIVEAWKHFLKEYGKVKKNKKSGEYYLEDVEGVPISGKKKINLYLLPEQEQAVVYIDLHDGFLNSESPEYSRAIQFLEQYQTEVEIMRYKQLIAERDEHIQALNKELKKLSKREGKLHGRIEAAKQTIRESEEELKVNISLQFTRNKERKEAQKQRKDLEDTLKEIQRKSN